MPVVALQALGIQKCLLQTVEFPQVQHTDEIVDFAVVMRHQVPTTQKAQNQRQVPVIQKVQKTAEAPQEQHGARDRGHPVPQIRLEHVAEVIQVIP